MIKTKIKAFNLLFILALGFNLSFVSCLKEPTLPTGSSSTSNSGSGSTGTSGTNTGGTNTGGTNTGGTNTGGNNNNLPATGKFSVKIYYEPQGSCQANGIDHTLRFYSVCEHGSYVDGDYAGIWSLGSDAGGKYKVCLFGNEQGEICIHGTKQVGRLYKLEWSAHPDKSSYPNSCIISGLSTIDFKDQMKNVIIKWD